MEIVEEAREEKRIMIVMEVSFIDFDQKKKQNFLTICLSSWDVFQTTLLG